MTTYESDYVPISRWLPWLVWSVIAAVIVLGAGWRLGWWLQASAVNHRAHIARTSYEFQTTLRTEMERQILDVRSIDVEIGQSPANAAPLQAQRTAEVSTICLENQQVIGSDIPPLIAQFTGKECQ